MVEKKTWKEGKLSGKFYLDYHYCYNQKLSQLAHLKHNGVNSVWGPNLSKMTVGPFSSSHFFYNTPTNFQHAPTKFNVGYEQSFNERSATNNTMTNNATEIKYPRGVFCLIWVELKSNWQHEKSRWFELLAAQIKFI